MFMTSFIGENVALHYSFGPLKKLRRDAQHDAKWSVDGS